MITLEIPAILSEWKQGIYSEIEEMSAQVLGLSHMVMMGRNIPMTISAGELIDLRLIVHTLTTGMVYNTHAS